MSGGDRFSYSSAPVRRISSIQFGILDPDFIVRDKDIMYLYNTSTNAFLEGWVLWGSVGVDHHCHVLSRLASVVSISGDIVLY